MDLVLEQEIVNRDTLAMIVRKRKKVDISNLIDSYSYIRKEIGLLILTAR